MALESNIVRQVMNLKTAAEMWSRLGSLYELKDPTSVYLLLQKFYKYEIAKGTSIAAHVAEVEAMARQLEDLGCKQSEVELVAKMLHSLPVIDMLAQHLTHYHRMNRHLLIYCQGYSKKKY